MTDAASLLESIEGISSRVSDDMSEQDVENTDINALKAEIDEAVYDLFNLDESEREVIEGYLEVF